MLLVRNNLVNEKLTVHFRLLSDQFENVNAGVVKHGYAVLCFLAT